MNTKILLLCLILMNCFDNLHAKDNFSPDGWSRGLHLLAGGGVNTSYYSSLKFQGNVGIGLNFKTDLGYFFNDSWAVELSSTVKFDKLQEFLIWDTLFTMGVRYRMGTHYLRIFYGRAPTVFYALGDQFIQFKDRNVARLQYDGPVLGSGLGKMFQTSSGTNWFVELTGTFQNLEKESLIGMQGEVPVVLQSTRQKNTDIYSLIASIGVLVF